MIDLGVENLQVIIEIAVYSFLFILGLFVGSFLNVVADRTSKEEDFVKGRSKCDNCNTQLEARDLFPLISYYFLKGKCRYCNNKLSFTYPLSEILTALAFVFVGFITSISRADSLFDYVNFVYLLIIFSVYITIILADAKYTLIPNVAVYTGVITSLIYYVSYHSYTLYKSYIALNSNEFGKYLFRVGLFQDQIIDSIKSFGLVLISATLISLFFLALILLTKGRGMGGGDLKLGFLIGLVNGFPYNVLAIFLGFVFGAVYSLVLILVGQKKMKDTIPFGPFLILGSFITLLFGVELVRIYLSL